MTKHTPGKWKVITEATAREVDVFEIAEISHFRVIPDRPDTWATQGDAFADARLIAAAPELLESVKNLLDAVTTQCEYETNSATDEWVQAARAAIAKATGEQT